MKRPLLAFLVTLTLLALATSADAALTTPNCLAKKRQAQGKLQLCRATADAKALQGKAADVAKCNTKFAEAIATLTAKAVKAGVGCRFRDNGDGTVTDYDTGLQWEQKNDAGGGQNISNPHDVDNLYSWSGTGTAPDGSAFRSFLSRLNNCTAGALLNFSGFAFHCDWRLPTLDELQTILLAPPPCSGVSVCIDPIFGPTTAESYWTLTGHTDHPDSAFDVYFGPGSLGPGFGTKTNLVRARAVRGGL
jgi:hypothetical protein